MRFGLAGPASFGPVSPDTPPLDPTAEQARAQLLQELAKPQYQAARPSPLDQLADQLGKWFTSLFDQIGVPGGGSSLIILVIVVAVIAAAVVGFLLFGLPRINRRSTVTGTLFGDDDDRDSAALRSAAVRAAADGDFTTAIEEIFRAIARGLAERTVVTTFPGTTAHSFAVQAGSAFPDFAADLAGAADSFDAVRYLGATGTEAQWLRISALDAGLRAARPVLDAVDA
jgi:hypothetical protein